MQDDATWRDNISRGDALRINFSSSSIESVDIEFKMLSSSERVAAEVRDSSGALLGTVEIPGQGSNANVFTATIDQSDLDTPGAIASVTLSRGASGTNFVVGAVSATESAGSSALALNDETASDEGQALGLEDLLSSNESLLEEFDGGLGGVEADSGDADAAIAFLAGNAVKSTLDDLDASLAGLA